jgi:hypothetical protein
MQEPALSNPDESRQGWVEAVRGILTTMGLMLALELLIIFLSIRILSDPFANLLVEVIAILIAAAGGAALGIRLRGLEWRFTVPPALLSGILLIAIARLELPILEFDPLLSSLWIEMDSTLVLDLRLAGIFLDICGGGVLLLPFLDPLVRQDGPRPARWKVAAAAFSLALLILAFDYLVSGGYLFGLLGVIFGSILAGILVGAGLILTLINLSSTGAWVGGLGLCLQAFSLIAWRVLGSPFFP